jgi:type I restriction-modification system DNA methylase subunit
MPKLYCQGHGSYRIATNDKPVICIDPCCGSGGMLVQSTDS